MSESVDTQQTSIVFMGRDSFRMQIVGAEATPEPMWESKTQRIIERRKNDRERRAGDRRRSTDAPALAESPELPAPSPMRRTIILMSFVTFVSGAAVATAMDRLRRKVMPYRTAQTERVQAVTVPPAPPAPTAIAQPSAEVPVAAPPPAPIVEPLPPPAPAFLEARTAPETTSDAESAPEPQKRPAVAKAMPVPRGALTPALRPRRAAAAVASPTASPTAPRALNVDPFGEPPAKTMAAKPAAHSQWVDPFAE